jgi:hypothetical protein
MITRVCILFFNAFSVRQEGYTRSIIHSIRKQKFGEEHNVQTIEKELIESTEIAFLKLLKQRIIIFFFQILKTRIRTKVRIRNCNREMNLSFSDRQKHSETLSLPVDMEYI